MLFYKICANTICDKTKEEESFESRVQPGKSLQISNACNKFSEKLCGKGFLFLSYFSSLDGELEFGLILREKIDINKFMKRFLLANRISIMNEITIVEISFRNIERMLMAVERREWIEDINDILTDFQLEELSGRFRSPDRIRYDEHIISCVGKSVVYAVSNRYFTRKSFNEELDRIYANEKHTGFVGHPVDYLIETDDESTSKGVTKLLIQALYSEGRLESGRYSEIVIAPGKYYGYRSAEALYKASAGGTIVINVDVSDFEDEDVAFGDLNNLEGLCDIAHKYRRDVLSIICLPRVCSNIKRKIFENMNGCTFVEIREDNANYDDAVEYLKTMASNMKIRCDKKLFSQLEYEAEYLTPELNAIFDGWYSKKLKNNVFKQYKDLESVDITVAKEKPRGSAYDELNEMIGLKSAKMVINQALDSYKARKLFKDKGMVSDTMANHMIFTGNPGTAKTTVARLFTRIMKENDIIEKGQIVEVGRGDLVGKYVGWTAPTIQKKFKEALGGVLFIDEAYSLVDDRDGMFGDEAINTIVQEMENYRGEVIVIFAGYPDKMEGFLQKNPGLRSRIAHHVHFEDYTPAELCEIAKLIAKQKGVNLDEGAMDKINQIMEMAVKEDDFGNGRFVRNVIEKAKMAQATRLVHMDVEAVTSEDVKRICAEDIEIPKATRKEVRRIGFV